MSVDLTKPIHVKLDDEYGAFFEIMEFHPYSYEDVEGIEINNPLDTGILGWEVGGAREAYRRLFERAPGLYRLARLIADIDVEMSRLLDYMLGVQRGARGFVASIELGGGPWDQAAFERLFEPSKRMKLEHEKMLAMLKEIYSSVEACHGCISSLDTDLEHRYLTLIAAIEDTASSSQPIDNEVAQLRAELTVSKAVQAQELDALQRVTSKE